MAIDTEVIIIGAGMSGLGLAVQLVRHYRLRSFQILEKVEDVGGTWLVNTYPGCGCDVASHFYSYSFALNPDWSQKFSLRSEIQAYFRGVAERYDIVPHIQFSSTVQTARWDDAEQVWEVTIHNRSTDETSVRRCRILISAVGSLSVPQPCNIPGVDDFKGSLFHSAQWDHSFDWTGKKVVVVGNGCSATQFVPVMANTAGRITQFARQAHFLAERPNPTHGPMFKTFMRYFPGLMRLYRLKLYADMEMDFAGFDIETGQNVRQRLKDENERYVKRMAPEKYWHALIPRHQIGCKRKVMDTDYLTTLHSANVELVHDDPIDHFSERAVVAKSGRVVNADAIILATGFQVAKMLVPMQIIGENGLSLNDYWNENHQGAAQAYFGTCVPGFKNFFTLMGPNTITGHLSVIYTVECQINFVSRLLEPVLRQHDLLSSRGSGMSSSSAPTSTSKTITSVNVKRPAAIRDSDWLQKRLKRLVWASGCTSWALDPETGLNIAMYPEYQFWFWWRSIFIPSSDFEYEVRRGNQVERRSLVVGGQKILRRVVGLGVLLIGAFYAGLKSDGLQRLGHYGESVWNAFNSMLRRRV